MNTCIASRSTFSWHHVPNINKANKFFPVGIMIGAVLSGQVKPGFHYTANATTTTQKQSDYKVEQSSFTLIALF